MKKNNDEAISALIAEVEKQKLCLGKKARHVLETNGIFKYEDPKKFFNINTVNDVVILVEAMAFLLRISGSYREACIELACSPDGEFKWCGYSIHSWKSDFMNRIRTIQWNTKKAQLELTEKKLKELMSEDAKTASALDEIKASLGL